MKTYQELEAEIEGLKAQLAYWKSRAIMAPSVIPMIPNNPFTNPISPWLPPATPPIWNASNTGHGVCSCPACVPEKWAINQSKVDGLKFDDSMVFGGSAGGGMNPTALFQRTDVQSKSGDVVGVAIRRIVLAP